MILKEIWRFHEDPSIHVPAIANLSLHWTLWENSFFAPSGHKFWQNLLKLHQKIPHVILNIWFRGHDRVRGHIIILEWRPFWIKKYPKKFKKKFWKIQSWIKCHENWYTHSYFDISHYDGHFVRPRQPFWIQDGLQGPKIWSNFAFSVFQNISSPDGTEMHSKVTKNVKIFGSEGEGGKPPCDPPSFILVAGAREKKGHFFMIWTKNTNSCLPK